jgi:hypothetical protein
VNQGTKAATSTSMIETARYGRVHGRGRRSLLDISEAATKVTRKFDQPGSGDTAPARSSSQRRQ